MTGANLTHYTLSGPVFLLVSSEVFHSHLSPQHRHGCIALTIPAVQLGGKGMGDIIGRIRIFPCFVEGLGNQLK